MVDTLAWDGTISSSDFYKAASAFLRRWKLINSNFPSWSWVPSQKLQWISSDKVEGYLSLEKICLLRPLEEKGECSEERETAGYNNEFLDEATLVSSPSDHQEVHYYDFHILHCASYGVPILYFRAYCSDGLPLIFEEIEKDLPSQSKDALLDSKWTFITQEEMDLVSKVPLGLYVSSQLTCLSHLVKTSEAIKKKLTPGQLRLFRKTAVGHLLDVDLVFNGQLIHCLLLREVNESRDLLRPNN